jgi:hypothetical protein
MRPIRKRKLGQRIREICQIRVRYGYRRVHVLLRREGRSEEDPPRRRSSSRCTGASYLEIPLKGCVRGLSRISPMSHCRFGGDAETDSGNRDSLGGRLSWSRLSEQHLRVDKWSLCRG